MFYLMMRFILIYLRLYLFKALFNIQSFIFTPIPIISNDLCPFLSNSKFLSHSKNFKQTLSIACL
ncbi:hypothetical protein ECC33_08230 [Helicobacter pylori]|nr:hypothetical protein ECC33_08230 [Helicobacter pylori]